MLAHDEQPRRGRTPVSTHEQPSSRRSSTCRSATTATKRVLFIDQALERLRAIPGVIERVVHLLDSASPDRTGTRSSSSKASRSPSAASCRARRGRPISERVLRHHGHPPAEGARIRQPRRRQLAEVGGRQRNLRAPLLRRQQSDRRTRQAGLAGRQDPVARNRRRGQRRPRRTACGRSDAAGLSAGAAGRPAVGCVRGSGAPSTRPRSGAPSKPPFTRSIRTCRSSTSRRWTRSSTPASATSV